MFMSNLLQAGRAALFFCRRIAAVVCVASTAFLFVLMPALMPTGVSAAQPPLQKRADADLRVMSFNLRHSGLPPPNAWPQRRPVMREVIQQQAPDVIGTQEGLYDQVQDLQADFPGYGWIGQGRDGGKRGEFMAVFYRKDRLQVLQHADFWLSDTPEAVGSRSWGNSARRMVTWARFRDRLTGRQFYFFNTHFDHRSENSRDQSAALVLERVRQLRTALPVVLVGDFNAKPGWSKVYNILVNRDAFTDVWMAAARRNTVRGTSHRFQGPAESRVRKDWILIRGPITALESEIVTFARNGQYPSDHFPVVTRLRFTSG